MEPWTLLTFWLVASIASATFNSMTVSAQDNADYIQDYGDEVFDVEEDTPGLDPLPENDVIGGDLMWKEGSYMRDSFLTLTPASAVYNVVVNGADAVLMNRTEVVRLMDTFYSTRSVYCLNFAPDSVVPKDPTAIADGRCSLMSQRARRRVADLVADLYMTCPEV